MVLIDHSPDLEGVYFAIFAQSFLLIPLGITFVRLLIGTDPDI
jgi:hypothetical protein